MVLELINQFSSVITTPLGEWDVSGEYDLTPQGIINFLDLKKPIYYETSEWEVLW